MTLLPPKTSAGYSCGSIVTPLSTSADDDDRSTQTPLAAFIGSVVAHNSTDYVSHMRLPFVLGACAPVTSSPPPTSTTDTGRATPPLAAYITGDGHSSSSDSTSTTSAVPFIAQEIARLRHIPTASSSSSPIASSLTSLVEPLSTLEITKLQCHHRQFLQVLLLILFVLRDHFLYNQVQFHGSLVLERLFII